MRQSVRPDAIRVQKEKGELVTRSISRIVAYQVQHRVLCKSTNTSGNGIRRARAACNLHAWRSDARDPVPANAFRNVNDRQRAKRKEPSFDKSTKGCGGHGKKYTIAPANIDEVLSKYKLQS